MDEFVAPARRRMAARALVVGNTRLTGAGGLDRHHGFVPGLDADGIAAVTTANFRRLFPKTA